MTNDSIQQTTKTMVYRPLDPKRHGFQTKSAVLLTIVTMALLVCLAVFYGDPMREWTNASSDEAIQRFLNEQQDNQDDDEDYSQFSCRYIYEKTPDPGWSQCRFARTCNGGSGIWAPFVFCSKRFSKVTLFVILSPFLILWMLILFRLLGSTAEDYFSPSLEMFSVKLGLPPRFAGVTLLALGNGAADVSATMSAIVSDQENGYKLSLGALTGAAMMVGGVVGGIVVLVAGGVPCRGALVRDVLSLLITVLIVWKHLASGTVGPGTVSLFLSLYALFVCLVLVADIYHRAVVLPRLEALELANRHADPSVDVGMENQGPEPPQASALTRVISAFSNYDNLDPSVPTITLTGENPAEQDRPMMLHGARGILHGDGILSNGGGAVTPAHMTLDANDGNGGYALIEEHIDHVCTGGGPGFGASNWTGAWHDNKQDVIRHANEVWDDIAYNGDVSAGEKFLLLCELPFTIFRKVRIVAFSFFGFFSSWLTDWVIKRRILRLPLFPAVHHTHSLRGILQSRCHCVINCTFTALVSRLPLGWTRNKFAKQGKNTLLLARLDCCHHRRSPSDALCSRWRGKHGPDFCRTVSPVWLCNGSDMD